jgi:hypothetical protein
VARMGLRLRDRPRKIIPPPATLNAHNLDPNIVTILFTAQFVTATGNRCRVSLRRGPYALKNPASKPRPLGILSGRCRHAE